MISDGFHDEEGYKRTLEAVAKLPTDEAMKQLIRYFEDPRDRGIRDEHLDLLVKELKKIASW